MSTEIGIKKEVKKMGIGYQVAKKYRPEGWTNRHCNFMRDNPKRLDKPFNGNKGCVAIGFVEDLLSNAYEAGADAMLEGLKKEAVILSIAGTKIDTQGLDIVLIPRD